MTSLTRSLLRIGSTLAIAAILGVTVPSAVHAQTPTESASVLLEVAIQFEADGASEVATAIYQLIVRDYPNTPAAAEARSRLTQARSTASASSGRTELKVWSTLYGLWLGVAVPGALGADGSEPYGAGLLLGGPVGFLTGRAIAESRPLSIGQARAITWGGTWGTWQGLGWSLIGDLEGEAVFGTMLAGGVAGILVGGALSTREISDGLATTINLGSLWGSWFGVAGAVLADLDGEGSLAASLIGGNLGLIGSALGGRNWNLSRSRARIISVAGVMGGLGGAGVDLLVQPDDEKVAIAIPLIGSVIGLAIGARATRNHDRPGSVEGAQDPASSFGAFLNWSDGEFSLGAPLPVPVSNGIDRAMHVPMVRIRF